MNGVAARDAYARMAVFLGSVWATVWRSASVERQTLVDVVADKVLSDAHGCFVVEDFCHPFVLRPLHLCYDPQKKKIKVEI